jgi:hypothetical protein
MMSVTHPACVRKPRPAPVRAVWLDRAPSSDEAILTIAMTHRPTEKGRQVNDYYIRPIPSDFGRAFLVEKFLIQDGTDPEAREYHVLLDVERSSCDCRGFLRWGKPCKHLLSVEELVAAGRL